jgi:acylpyruvate hydrolase
MRFASAIHEGRPLAVAINGEFATPLSGVSELGLLTPSTVLSAPPFTAEQIPVSELEFRPVIPNPGKVICIGLNYREHIAETQNSESEYPVLFTKFPSSVTGAYADVALPPESNAIDYEGELTVVIGSPVRRVSPERALEAVAGFTVGNDITMRDFQYKTAQYTQGKSWDASCPVGPQLVTPDEVGDAQNLDILTKVNGETVQHSSTAMMIFDIATLISTISVFTALAPGDLILTGTPSGVGFRRDPPLLLKPGDEVVVEIERIGRLENRMVAEQV